MSNHKMHNKSNLGDINKLPPEKAILLLKDKGLAIVESIKVVKETYGLGLAEAKKIVTEHPAWSSIIDRSKLFHDELVDQLKEANGE